MSATVQAAQPSKLLGLPTAAWTFGLRNWLAIVLALLVGFWLQLESASSAAVAVGILALQTRAQTFQKSIYRFVGTVVGVVMSIVIAGLFNEQREMFLVACAAWLAICVYFAGLLDGNRAYGAVLSGYTVAIVAIPQIDSPLDTWSSGVNRGAAEVLGILAIAFVNEAFRAPDLYPATLKKLEGLRDRTLAFASESVRALTYDPVKMAELMQAITALHPEITALPAESAVGQVRAAAAANAVASMVRTLSGVRAVSATLGRLGSFGRDRAQVVADAVDGDAASLVETRGRIQAILQGPETSDDRLIAANGGLVLLDQAASVREAIGSMRSGNGPTRGPRLRIYKSHNAARRSGFRAFFATLLVAFLLIIAGWPQTETTLLILAATVGISATNPDPKAFAKGAVIAMPLACLAAGITEFLVLDGADFFPQLALALLPIVMIASLMIGSGNLKLFGIGFLMLVFFPVLLSPANPQEYNPQTYLYSSFQAITAVILLAVALSTLLPVNDTMRQGWILRSSREDLRRVLRGQTTHRDIQGSAYHEADRLGQLAALNVPNVARRDDDIASAMHIGDLTLAGRRIHAGLRALPATHQDLAADAVAALVALDTDRLRRSAHAVIGTEPGMIESDRASTRRLASELLFAAALVEAHREDYAL